VITGSIRYNNKSYEVGDIIETDSGEDIYGRFVKKIDTIDKPKLLKEINDFRSVTKGRENKERLRAKYEEVQLSEENIV
jgi:hypothetical protein